MKIKNWFFYACLASCISLGTISCGDDDPIEEDTPGNNDNGNNNENGNENENDKVPDTPDGVLSIAEQQQKLEDVSVKFLEYVDAENFSSIDRLVEYTITEYVDHYNTNNVSKWFEECLDAATSQVTQANSRGYVYNNYARVFKLSNFTGHFTAKNDSWVYTPANDLKFYFNDQYGKPCELSVTYKGEGKKVYAGYDEEWEWDYGYTDYIINCYDQYVYVPEETIVTLLQDGEVLVKAVVKADLSSMQDVEFQLDRDNYNATAEAYVKDYIFKIEQANYKANIGAIVQTSLSKGKEQLVYAKASYDGKIGEYEEDIDVKKVNLEVNIMNQIQVKGDIDDWNKFYNNMEQADTNWDNENNFKSYLNNANDLLSAYLYFNTDTKQAQFKLIPVSDSYYGGEEWYAEPAIFFKDGTSYNTFEVFFNEKDFAKLIRVFNNFVEGFNQFGNYQQ